MKNSIPEPLFVLEMANNHMGDVEHGIRIIREMGEVVGKFPFKFAFKLQYRDLDSFIHPAMKGRQDIKYIKRFSETRLTTEEFNRLVAEMRENGFLTMSTPFDEASLDLIESQKLDFIKIASCSFNDWPLLERIVLTDLPIIASTAGASLEDIDRVISFFMHRDKDFAILHCVGEYPTPVERMNLSQLDFLQARYPGVKIGFSTHEDPADTDIVKLAMAKGAAVFEKHVGVSTDDFELNAYSASPAQVEAWLQAAQASLILCGSADRRLLKNESESNSLRSLRRGVFAKRPIAAGETIAREDIYFAFPPQEDQFAANDWSKYAEFKATAEIAVDVAIAPENCERYDQRKKVLEIAQQVKQLLRQSGITFPGCTDLEISHHYGIDKFYQTGLTMLTVVNRSYCKKLLILLPGQRHPEQYHKQKDETFHLLYGDLQVELDGVGSSCVPGDVVVVDPGVTHAFSTENGAIIEEISSTHFKDDSFYVDPEINANLNRKTLMSYWIDA